MTGPRQPLMLSMEISGIPPEENMTAPRKTLFINDWTDPIQYEVEERKHFDSIESKPIPRRSNRRSYIRRKK